MNRNREIALLAVVGLLAGYFLVWPFYRAWFPLDVGPTDAWNAYFQDLAFSPGLYPPADALITNNYPPLSFYFIAALGMLFSADPLYVGRAVSILAVLGIGVEVSIVVRQLGGKPTASALAGLWLVAILARAFHSYVGRNDPQLLAELIMLLGLIWFLRNMGRGMSALGPLLLMVLAGFFKHNIVAIPLTAVIWLSMRDGWKAMRSLVIIALVIAAGLLICHLAYPTFLANMLAPRLYVLKRVLIAVGRLQWVTPALIIVIIWAWRLRGEMSARFTALLVGIALTTYLIQWTGTSVVDNAQFDLVIATAIGIGMAYNYAAHMPLAQRWGAIGVRTAIVAILAARLLATGKIESALILTDASYRALFFVHSAIAKTEAARVSQIEGPVLCDNDVVCRMAGKPFDADDYTIQQLVTSGTITSARLSELFRLKGVTIVDTDRAAASSSLERDLFAR